MYTFCLYRKLLILEKQEVIRVLTFQSESQSEKILAPQKHVDYHNNQSHATFSRA